MKNGVSLGNRIAPLMEEANAETSSATDTVRNTSATRFDEVGAFVFLLSQLIQFPIP
jgi:hypothetical protein